MTGSDVPRIPDDLVITGGEAADLGGRLLAEGRPFHAHEVFEAAWKTGPEAERDLWQGLAQIAVGLTHARRGNARGAVTLLRRGAQRVSDYAGTGDARRYGIHPGFVASRAEDLATRIERDGLPAIPAANFLLPLQAPTSLTWSRGLFSLTPRARPREAGIYGLDAPLLAGYARTERRAARTNHA
jgi:uncharacterized protein